MRKIIIFLSKVLLGLLLLVGLILIFSFLNTGQLGRYIIYNNADIMDYEKFPAQTIAANKEAFSFYTATPEIALGMVGKKGAQIPFDEYLKKNNTVAFLAIRNDTILYEHYFEGYQKKSIIPSFSIAKSITSLLVGCAIDDGLIQSVEDPVIQYIPELKKNGLGDVRIKHLLQMTSGITFNESYTNPFSDAASLYYGDNLREVIYNMKPKEKAGTKFNYMSGNTQVLGLVLDKVLYPKTISSYLEEKVWGPLGMEFNASWSTDFYEEDPLEKTFCCINARAIDFAKIGRLYLNKGQWGDRQIVSRDWIERSTQIDSTQGSVDYYQYSWWLPSHDGDFMAEGILGQFVYVNPAKNLIFVRMGEDEGEGKWPYVFSFLSKNRFLFY